MRMIMLVQLPIEPFNTIARNGSMGTIMRRILETIKPEAAYFSERDGHRGGIFVVNVNEDAEVPALAEPWSAVAGTRRTLSTEAVVTVTDALMPARTVAGGLVSVTVTA